MADINFVPVCMPKEVIMSPKKNVPILAFVISLAAVLACISTPVPGNYYVDPAGNDSNDCLTPATACLTIGAAIDKASAGDIINVQDGNYVEIDAGVPTVGVVVDKDLTILGVGDARIDGDGLRTVVSIWPGTSAVMTNLTIHNGGGEATGGIVIGSGSTLVLSDSTVRNNEPSVAALGLGFYNTGGILNLGTLTMYRVEVMFNNAFEPIGSEAWGGGIHNQGTLTMTDTTVAMNYADNRGAGLYNEAGATASLIGSMVDDNMQAGGIWNEGTLVLTGTTVRANTVGGTLYDVCAGIGNYGTLEMTDGVVADNGSLSYYAGICNLDAGSTAAIDGTIIIENIGSGVVNYGTMDLTGVDIGANTAGGGFNYLTMTISESVVHDNVMTPKAGGLWNVSGTLNVVNTTLSGNQVTMWGGGLMNNMDATLTIVGSTISGNSADIQGAGIFNEGEVHITNSTISGNSAPEGAGIGNNGEMWLSSVTVSNNNPDGISSINVGVTRLLNSIVAGNSVSDCFGVDFITQGHNLDSDATCNLNPAMDDLVSVAPLLAPLADNGGPTFTHALLPGSPAIDTGAAGGDCPSTDQRGVSRPQGPECDIGAYTLEFGVAIATLPPPGDGGILRGTMNDDASCRRGPATDYPLTVVVEQGQTFPIEGRNTDTSWLWISTDRGYCWILRVLMDVDGDPEDATVRGSAPLPGGGEQGCWVKSATSEDPICTVPCPPNASPGGACTP
jgi:hypothetical protein